MVLGGGAFAYSTWYGTAQPKVAPTSSGAPKISPSMGKTALSSKASASATTSAAAPAPIVSVLTPSVEPTVAPPEDMVFLAPGTFQMGEGANARKVTLTRGFFIERTEVTVRSYQACIAKRMCSAADHVALIPEQPAGTDPDAGAPTADEFSERWSARCNEPRKALDHPINCVDFRNAETYCRWRGRRLPTEAEWELAARGLAGRAFAWGEEKPACSRACYDKNSSCRAAGEDVATCPAGAHPQDRTPEDVHDLAGNVSEWVADGFVVPLPGGVDPVGSPSASLRVTRGGGFLDPETSLRGSWRNAAAPVTAHVTIGFRCAMDAGNAQPRGADAGAPKAP